ncbi:hypothetical protein BDA96_08G056400 [Sorghum bicolor]|uniref:Uncharacterized protein n=2 Tax=Sorghum bicolor TaxID=4558 RepID=A0A921QGX0_SORBI|nr:hypothetical protein SORBI_3008G052800 [Sorghum bicolor]KAG0520236.1 hypothetical protein BDA96_08G056400 [Sorghum bicolor]
MHSKYVLPLNRRARMEPGQGTKALSQSVTARPIAPHLHPSSLRPIRRPAINPTAQARRKGSPCRRKEGERAWSSLPRSSTEEQSAPRRALQRRRSRRRRRPRPPARTAQGGHGAAPPPSLGGRGKGRDSHYSSRARELDDDSTTPMGVR